MWKWLKSLFAKPEPFKLYWYAMLDDHGGSWLLSTNYGRFRGGGSVWRRVSSGVRCSTSTEFSLSDLYKQCEWDVNDRKRHGNSPRRADVPYHPDRDEPIAKSIGLFKET